MNRMISTLSTLSILAAIAGPAAAQDVEVSLAGKDARTVSAEIDKAAWAVCTAAWRHGDVEFHALADCAAGAAFDARAQVATHVASATSVAALASN